MTKRKVAKKKTYRQVYEAYLARQIKLEKYQKMGVVMLIVVIAGFVGWLYEFLLVWATEGQIYMKGGNLLPWMNIYAIGALLLIPASYYLRKRPWAVFLVSVLVTGVVELLGGWLIYVLFDGARYWNYDSGTWAWGSINGFVCPLSVTIFGIGALLLVYLVMPFCVYLAMRMPKRAFLTLAITLFALVMVDEAVNLILKNLGGPTAMDFYRSLGLEYK